MTWTGFLFSPPSAWPFPFVISVGTPLRHSGRSPTLRHSGRSPTLRHSGRSVAEGRNPGVPSRREIPACAGMTRRDVNCHSPAFAGAGFAGITRGGVDSRLRGNDERSAGMTRKTREWRPSSFRPAPHPSSFQPEPPPSSFRPVPPPSSFQPVPPPSSFRPERSGGPESRGAGPSGDSRLRGNDEKGCELPLPRLRGDRPRGNNEGGCGFPPTRE